MAEINAGRWTAEIEGDFVVFIIGARVNSKLQALRALGDLGGRNPRMLHSVRVRSIGAVSHVMTASY